MIAIAPRPRAEIEAAQRADALAARPAEVEVLGVEEVLALEEPSVTYRGRTYAHRILSFRAGVLLAHGHLGPQEMARLLKSCARPRGWRGWLWRWRPDPFRAATEAEVRDLVRQLTGAPAEGGLVPVGTGDDAPAHVCVDELRRVGEFAVGCPWGVGPSGSPISWKAFLHGLRWIDQERARSELAQSNAVGAAFGGDDDGSWRTTTRARAYGRTG